MSNLKKPNPYKFFLGAALSFIAFIGYMVFAYTKLSLILSYLIAINITAFIFCGYDKSVAGKGTTRVPEIAFYILGLVGGSIGLIVGMNTLRHKTQKPKFQFIIALILIVQVLLLRYVNIYDYLYR